MTRIPFCDAARRLLDRGFDPAAVLVMTHAGSTTECLRSPIGVAAGLSVEPWPDDVSVPTFGPRMVCTLCGIIGADARPNWREQSERPTLTGTQWRTEDAGRRRKGTHGAERLLLLWRGGRDRL